MDNARKVFPTLVYADTLDEALVSADLVIVVTEWRQFRDMDPRHVGRLVAQRRIIDGRNVLDVDDWQAEGWRVAALGRSL